MSSKLKIVIRDPIPESDPVEEKVICDGKQCGLGKYSGGNGRYICPHNNLTQTHPELMREWDFDKNTDFNPQELSFGSKRKVWWRCSKEDICECHSWEASIKKRASCKRGCPFCAGQKTCHHKSFLIQNPKLSSEWDYEKNERDPNTVSSGSPYNAWWKCNGCPHGCHKWQFPVSGRSGNGGRCPFCCGFHTCIHQSSDNKGSELPYGTRIRIYESFINYRPELLQEWDYEKNDKNPGQLSRFSGYKAWWKCNGCSYGCHRWQCPISERSAGSNCPFCSGNQTCFHQSFAFLKPDLLSQWDYEKNEVSPETIPLGSCRKFWWKCDGCSHGCHRWKTSVGRRCLARSGCPFCATSGNKKVCQHSNLKTDFPEISEEWDYEKNKSLPENFSSYSSFKVSWICKQNSCGCHKWEASIANRVRGSGCPYCCSRKICPHNNLKIKNPELCEEWDYEKNKSPPENFAPHSGYKVWWICKNSSAHKWRTSIAHRNNYRGCPMCKCYGYSKISIQWLTEESEKRSIQIRHAENGGEVCLPEIGKVDGYHEETRTIFEFHGDLWHGNPEVFDPNDINPVSKKSYGELYQRTLARDAKIRELGYNLVVIWESEYLDSKLELQTN